MSLGKRLFIGEAAAAACSTDSVQPFGVDSAYSSNVALYQLDSDGGTTNNVPDTVGNYNGTAYNVTYSTGKYGNAAVFNGSTSYIDSGISTDILNSDYTISFWGKSTSSTGIFLNTNDNTTTPFVRLDFTLNGDLYFAHRNSSGTVYSNSSIVSGMDDGNWHHVVITKDNTSVKAYKDGNLEGTITSTSGTYSNSTTFNFGRNNYNANGAYNFNGDLDQVRIYDKALSSDEVSTLYNETTSTASDTNVLDEGSGLALYSLDYDASDAGGNYDGTATDVTFGVDGQINYGASFNGSSSYIDTNLQMPSTTTFTFSCWFYKNDTANYHLIGDFNSTATLSSGRFRVQLASSGDISVGVGNGTNMDFSVFTPTVSLNEIWRHIAVTVDGTSVKAYIDGSQVGTTDTSQYSLASGVNNFAIGAYNTSSGKQNFNGTIDQVRIFQKALSSDEVSTLYGETACVYTSTTDQVNYQGTNAAYYKFDNTAEDETGNYDGTETDITYEFGRFGQAAVFNGSSSKIDLGNNFNLTQGQGFTISMWVNPDSVSSNFSLISKDNSTNRNWTFSSFTGSESTPRFFIKDTSNNQIDQEFTSQLSAGTWSHLVVTWNGGLNATDIKLYFDGNLEPDNQSGSATISNVATNTQSTLIGDSGNYGNHFDGKIDQVRIYNSALDATAVANLYNEKQAYITKNASDPFGDNSEISFYDFESNAGNTSQDATGNNDAYFTNGVTFTSGSGLFGTYAAYLNGSNNYITFNVLAGITTDYSFSLWAIPHASNNFPFLTSNTGSTTTNYCRFALHQNGNYYFDFGNNSTARMTGATPSEWRDGNWHHFTWVSSSTEKHVYVDGSLYNSISSTAGISNQSTVTLGHYLTNYANGYYDQVRVFDRALDGDEVFKLYAEVIN